MTRRLLAVAAMCLSIGIGSAGAQIVRLPHADTTRGNYFGTAVSLQSHRALVGASGEDSCGPGGGAAYIYAKDSTSGYWQKEARLVPLDCEPGLAFGRRVALDGGVAIIAASQEFFASERSNAVYLFAQDSSHAWQQVARLTVPREFLEGAAGSAVALGDGRAVFTTSGDPTGSQRSGAAYVYRKHSGNWIREARLVGSGGLPAGVFGGAAALDGPRLVVASSGYFSRQRGSVYVFDWTAAGGWSENARIDNVEDFFISLDVHQDEVLIGQSKAGRRESGSATLYGLDSTGTWFRSAELTPPFPYSHGGFGTEVALYGDRALVVGYDEQLRLDYNVDRVVYIYARRPDGWHFQGILDIGLAAFASSIDLHGRAALVGAASADAAGAAYVIRIP